MIHRETRAVSLLGIAEVLVQRAEALTALWRFRARTRDQLRNLPPHLLKDIGVHPGAADAEARKPFWR